uniref:Uncharacterized protein n=1 Tax=Siphoviridae sp. ctGDt6 TaxID=2825408 RepID=A0A8S5U857_9CAUD|nr:MAG TPA: hypothetical protein [Siphoviridae sp. ctGDt6]DAM22304.1 MAG TPA: hypothetical protein [Bacteriophage sp.]DAM84122.1 MAG TPA: hypothetical protein [Bacteriophage sp.]DAO65539.1 MAG TPA: hypothetical protein [Bacteriophage sp.]
MGYYQSYILINIMVIVYSLINYYWLVMYI